MLGIGSSAFSHVAGVNQQNIARLSDYLAALDRNELPLWRAHALTTDERVVRDFVLQLKLGQAESQYFSEKYGVDILKRFESPLADLVKNGWLETTDTGVIVTRQGLLRIDRLLPNFYLPEHKGIRYS